MTCTKCDKQDPSSNSSKDTPPPSGAASTNDHDDIRAQLSLQRRRKHRQELKDRSCWNAWKESPRIKSLLLTLFVIFWVILQFICEFMYLVNMENKLTESLCDNMIPIWSIVIGTVLYLIYLIEALTSHTSKYLSNMRECELAFDTYLQCIKCKPQFWWHVECYHIETRARVVTDANGNSRTEYEDVEVVTHTASMYWQFSQWWDNSDEFVQETGLQRCSFDHVYYFADNETRNLYESERSQFQRDNDKDTHQRFSSEYIVARAPNILTFAAIDVPYFLRFTYFFYATLLLASFPFRVWMTSISSKKKFNMSKTVKKEKWFAML